MFDFIVTNWKDIVLVITGLITTASVIVKLTPSVEDDTILAKIVDICKVIGLYK